LLSSEAQAKKKPVVVGAGPAPHHPTCAPSSNPLRELVLDHRGAGPEADRRMKIQEVDSNRQSQIIELLQA